ncbi:nucleotidyltransferase [Candidatus Gracilibacteria bacterium]|nr:nucleotidyltransferase [Candidatus Gracilibacteria bacterium]
MKDVEKIIETKSCQKCQVSFDITDKDLEFYDKVSPVFGGNKCNIPTPSLCPDCRQQRRLAWRNERNLYKRECDGTGRTIISMYSPEVSIPVYNEAFWWSDSWDAMKYGQEIDESKSFFEQFDSLFQVVPQPPLINNFVTHENSDYANFSGNLQDCYLVFETASSSNLQYASDSRKCHNSLDLSLSTKLEDSYQCIDCVRGHQLFYSKDCFDCSNSSFLLDCKNCEYCYGCTGLVNKKYYINNVKYSKQNYFEERAKQDKQKYIDDFFEGSKSRIVSHMHGEGNEFVSGDYVLHSKNVSDCYNAKNLENGKYCTFLVSSEPSKDCYDYDYFGSVSRVYESTTIGAESDSILFSVNCWQQSTRNYYSNMCFACTDIFGCIGLKNQQYCIFNKQYSKQEYEDLVPKIIQRMGQDREWGEFFPSSISPFGYNETVAHEYFPLAENEGRGQGFNWSDYEAPFPKVEKTIPAHKLPRNIADIPDDILNWAIECEVTKKPFRIIPQELAFYRKHNISIPKRHSNQRHLDRMALRNSRKLFERSCDKCDVKMLTTYSPERPEKVYCEDCYNKEIY